MLQARHLYLGLAFLIPFFEGHFQANSAFGFEEGFNRQKEFITKGQMDIQLVSGPLFSSKILGNGTPTTNSWQNGVRLGWILNNPTPKQFLLRGNLEAMIEVSHAFIHQGPGSYWAGITALIRYNFMPPDSKWIPYVQAGTGVVHTDAHKDHGQDAIGQATEFNPQASLGIRYFFKEKWAVSFEGVFQHISNANLADRNAGLNFFGGFIGISYLFDRSGMPK
jgi:lipid A 3-O-deacylase